MSRNKREGRYLGMYAVQWGRILLPVGRHRRSREFSLRNMRALYARLDWT